MYIISDDEFWEEADTGHYWIGNILALQICCQANWPLLMLLFILFHSFIFSNVLKILNFFMVYTWIFWRGSSCMMVGIWGKVCDEKLINIHLTVCFVFQNFKRSNVLSDEKFLQKVPFFIIYVALLE